MSSLYSIAKGLYILAGQLDDLKKKYPQLQVDPLSSLKPKYYAWAVNQLIADENILDLVESLAQFEKDQIRLKEKDINKYKDLNHLKQALNALRQSTSQESKEVKAKGAKKLYEDAEYLLLRIESKQACSLYGMDTKWCITQQNKHHFVNNSLEGIKFYYWINKKLKARDPLQKVAITYQETKDGRSIVLYDSKNNTVHINNVPGAHTAMPIIIKDSKVFLSLKDQVKANPENFISDSHPEIRLLAVRYIDPKRLPALVNDKDPDVREEVFRRLEKTKS